MQFFLLMCICINLGAMLAEFFITPHAGNLLKYSWINVLLAVVSVNIDLIDMGTFGFVLIVALLSTYMWYDYKKQAQIFQEELNKINTDYEEYLKNIQDR